MRVCLHQVVFLATANVKSTIPAPLLDRMELIDLVCPYTSSSVLYLVTSQL